MILIASSLQEPCLCREGLLKGLWQCSVDGADSHDNNQGASCNYDAIRRPRYTFAGLKGNKEIAVCPFG